MMMDWQTMETAPKDGTPILVYDPDGFKTERSESWDGVLIHIIPVRWFDPSGFSGDAGWYTPLVDVDFGVWDDPSTDFFDVAITATHWMPLPRPPA